MTTNQPPQTDPDPNGTILAYAAGVALGVVFLAPPLSRAIASGDLEKVVASSVGRALLLAALSIVLVSFGVYTIYQSFVLFDR